MKKSLIIITIAILVSASLLAWYGFKYKKQKQDIVDTAKEKTETVIMEKTKKLYAVSDKKAKGFFLDKENERLRYYSEEGVVLEADFDGRNEKTLLLSGISEIEDVDWSPDGKNSLLKIKGKYYRHNIFSNETVPLSEGIDTAIWSDDGTKIAYKFFDSNAGKKSIRMADQSGDNQLELAGTDFRNVKLGLLRGMGRIAFWNSPRAEDETLLKTVSFYGGDEKTLFSSKKGADYNWSPNGKKAIISFSKDEGGFLMSTGVVSTDGSYIELGIPTLAEKTAWSLDNKTCFFAIPSFPENSRMPNDYEDGKISTTDTFWKINTENGEKSRLIELSDISGSFDASEISVTPNGRSLVFINKIDGLIYRLDF